MKLRTRGWRAGWSAMLVMLLARIAAFLLATAAIVASPSYAHTAQASWVALDNSPAGTPADIVFDPQASDPAASFFDIVVHGFWSTPRVGTDNLTYQQMEVPGLHVLQTIGSPELPYLPFQLGVVTGAQQLALANVSIISQTTVQSFMPWPHAVPPVIDVPGTPEQFSKDLNVYGGQTSFPLSEGAGATPVSGVLGELRGGSSEVYPFHWNPNGTLSVYTHVRYQYSHGGTSAQAEVGSAMVATSALDRMINAPTVQPWVHWNGPSHIGYYLFIYPAADEAQITPLVTQKEMRGYAVTTAHIEDIGATCSTVRAYIRAWYAPTRHGGDHYCLLAGDVDVIPMCTAPLASIDTDDLYGDVDGDGVDDLGKEVYVGRISMIDATDLSQQITRIINYEDHPNLFMDYDTAALIAYRTDCPQGTAFQDQQEKVRTALYASSAPSFETVYASSPGVTNANIDAAAQRDGILCYAGHGATTSWGVWDKTETTAEDYAIANVDALVNHPVNPIIWSLTCSSGSIQTADCFGEGWMEQNTDGAVAFYGGDDLTGIGGNFFLETALFKAVFDMGIVIHGQALEYGEANGDDPYNSYKYLLLGDPEMHIRRHRVLDPTVTYWLLDRPVTVPSGIPGPLDVRATTRLGVPVSGVQVSLWKTVPPVAAPARQNGAVPLADAAATMAVPELQANLYTAQDGFAHFQLPALSQGTLFVTLTDDDANAMSDAITVTAPAGVGGGPVGTLRLVASPSVTRGPTRIGFGRPLDRDAMITLRDVAGRRVRSIAVARGAQSVAWDGADESGASVPNGLYFANLSSGHAGGTARIVVAR